MLLGLTLAVASLKLTACFINSNPPNPHEVPESDSLDPSDALDASDASKEAK